MKTKDLRHNRHGGARKNAGRAKVDPSEKRQSVSVSLAPETLARLDAYAERVGISRSLAADTLIVMADIIEGRRLGVEGGDDHDDE